ncbi:MAG: hypothetical protein ACRDH0_06185 [Actinomycetota bacterium]
MRRTVTLAAVALAVAGCSTGQSRDFARYYDLEGTFSTNLPAANDISVIPPQPPQDGPGIVAGVVSAPPQPSPSPQGGLGGGLGNFGAQTEPADQTVYRALAVTTDTFDDLSEMTLFFLTGDPSVDVQVEQRVRLGEAEGRLIVADIVPEGQEVASAAAAFSLGDDGVGYIVVAVFPPGGWGSERSDFLKVVDSFRAGVPPGLTTIPLA